MPSHAVLSASGSHRWLHCTPSARLEQEFPDRSGESAREGTFAHALAELKLKNFEKPNPEKYKTEYGKMKKDGFYSRELEEYVDNYVSMVTEKLAEAGRGAVLIIEARLDFSDYVPEGFGRGDAVIIADGTMEVCDLKYGRTVPVRAEGNPQLRLYGLGALHEYEFFYDVDKVTMTICQPRNGGISSETLTVEELTEWGNHIRQTAETAFRGGGDLCAGDWCRFCRAAARCRALADYNLELEKVMFKSIDTLSDGEMAEILERLEKLKNWETKVKDYVYAQAMDGRVFKGLKLVEGRSVRKYSDEKAVSEKLLEEGYSLEEIYQPMKLLSITAMKKLLGKKGFGEILGGLIEKPAGTPVLVPESDKRPAVTAGGMFNDLGKDDN